MATAHDPTHAELQRNIELIALEHDAAYGGATQLLVICAALTICNPEVWGVIAKRIMDDAPDPDGMSPQVLADLVLKRGR